MSKLPERSPDPGPSAPTIPSILIVDDDELIRMIMRAELEDEGFAVVEACDGLEALEVCRAGAPDLLVADVMMPRMDGYELCRALRGQPDMAFFPILMATGLDDEVSIAAAYEAGATDFIPKPLQWTILRQRVRYMLRSSRAFQDLRRNQADLVAAKEAAEAGNRAKSEFLSTMSHELRTPLNAVIGLSTLMQHQASGPLPPKYLELAGLILESGHHLLSMIEDVLELAQAESNELALDRRPLQIDGLIAELADSMRERAQKALVAFTVDVEANLPAITADPARLKRILYSLVDNALKFTPKGGRARLSASCDLDGDLCLEVRDTGIGMSPDQIALALSPFGQADGASTRRYGGAGVGLPLARRLVELHGASLKIDSEEGRGVTAVVRFPQSLFAETRQLRARSA